MTTIRRFLKALFHSIVAIAAADAALAQECASYLPPPGWTGQGPSEFHWTVNYTSAFVYSRERLYGTSASESCKKFEEWKVERLDGSSMDRTGYLVGERKLFDKTYNGQCYATCYLQYMLPDRPGYQGPYTTFAVFYRAGTECPYGTEWSFTLNTCVEPPDDCEVNPLGGNPVVISTGRKKQIFEDYSNGPISIERTYRQNSIGGRWSFSFDTKLAGIDHSLSEVAEHTKISLYENGAFTTLIRSSANCWETPSGKCYLVDFTGDTIIIGKGSQTLVFDKNGLLIHSRNNGSSPEVSYSYSLDGKLITISHRSGSITVIKANGKVASIKDADIAISYAYDTNGMLEKVIWPDGAEDYYHYAVSSNTLLTEAGTNGIPYAYWSYDDLGRVNKSWHSGDRETTAFSYSESTVTVKNSLGKEAAYHYELISGARKLVKVDGLPSENCAPSSQYIGYSADGEVTTKTDRAGNVTLLERDALGRITQSTEGLKWSTGPSYGLGVDTS